MIDERKGEWPSEAIADFFWGCVFFLVMAPILLGCVWALVGVF